MECLARVSAPPRRNRQCGKVRKWVARSCACAVGEPGGLFLACGTPAARSGAPPFPLDRPAVAQSLRRRSLRTEHSLLRWRQGHWPVRRSGRHSPATPQGLMSVGHTCGCHSFRIPVLPSVYLCVFYPTFLFGSSSALSYSFIQTGVCGAEVRSVSTCLRRYSLYNKNIKYFFPPQ